MRKLLLRLAIATGIAAGLSATAAATWYAAMGTARTYALRAYGVPRGATNAILHAYAGAETYATLRKLGFGRKRAARGTELLGYANEWFEHSFKRLDTSAEVYKDLHNNLVGITAARWLEAERPGSGLRERLRLIAWLSKQREIPWWAQHADVGLSDETREVRLAMAFYRRDRRGIEAKTLGRLSRLEPEIAVQLR